MKTFERLDRPADQRFATNAGWLKSWHTFSFSDHFDPAWTNWHGLVVINEDIIAPNTGFGEHGHRDMAIITWVLSGSLEHQDSLGNGGVLLAGDTQVMQAGRGIRHSERNPSTTEPLHLYQCWVQPVATGLSPTYDQRSVSEADRQQGWCLLADRDGSRGGLILGADAVVAVSSVPAGQTRMWELARDRHLWVQVISGRVTIDGESVTAGDGVGLSHLQGALSAVDAVAAVSAVGSAPVSIAASVSAELLIFDLGAA